MGARLLEDGVSFRVWAPNATSVHVAGEFNDWSTEEAPLAPEPGGTWSAVVPGATRGQRYKYFIRNGEWSSWKTDPYTREVTGPSNDGVILPLEHSWEMEGEFRAPGWDELVVYEMHPGTFNQPDGEPPGTFDQIAKRLGYLADGLSVNAILLMPAVEFPGEHSLGYNPSHPFAVEQGYGGSRGLKRLVEAAHRKEIAVFLDVVYNHLGPGDLDLKVFDGWSEPTHPDGIYFYERGRIETPWGGPRPDYGRPEVQAFLLENALHWLDEYRIDGLRLDATNYIRTVDNDWREIPDGWRFMQRLNDAVDARFSWKLIVAEDMQDNPWITLPTSEGGAGFDGQWDREFVHPVRRALTTGVDAERDLHAVARAITHRHGWNAFTRVIFTESHDEVSFKNGKRRLPEDIWPGRADSHEAKKRSTLGAVLVMTTPGIPMIFQGQEFLANGAFDDSRRLDWEIKNANEGIWRLYRDLIRLRRDWSDSTRGLRGQHVNVHHLNDGDKVLAYHRWHWGGPRDDVIVVMNFSHKTHLHYRVGFPRAGAWRVRFSSDAKLYDELFGDLGGETVSTDGGPMDGLAHSAEVELAPYSALILSQD